jgi:hypothetical protein
MTIFVAFARPNDNLVSREVDVFDPETTAFHQPQSTTVKKDCHQTRRTAYSVDHSLDFFFREHDRQS